MDKDNIFTSCLGMFISIVALFVVGLFMNGWALSTIWNWFMPPIFHLISLTLWQAIGVSMVFELFTGTNKISKAVYSTKEDKNKSFTSVLIESLVQVVLVPILSVFFAWIVWTIAF